MANKKIIVGTMIVLAGIANSSPARADQKTQKQAQADAQAMVLKQGKVDEDYLRHQDAEYVNAFLAAYEEETASFAAAYQQGITDVQQKTAHTFQKPTAQLGYRRGVEQGQRLLKAKKQPPAYAPATADKDTVVNHDELPAVDDNQSYQVKTPTVDQAQFINRLAKPAQEIGRQYDLFPSVIIAQAALESNWGASDLGRAPYFNLFGVKGYFTGRTVNKPTSEYTASGKMYLTTSNFRQYSSDLAALKDYAEVLTAPLYTGVHRQNARDYRAATKALVGKYATDPHYNQKLNQLIESYQLTKYGELPQNSNRNTQPMMAAPPHSNSAAVFHEPAAAPVNKKENTKSPLPHYVPLLGGIGSAGLLELIRRFCLK